MLRTYRYENIAQDLREQIARQGFPEGKLPSERILMARYGVQRDTVRRALSLLADEGQILVEKRRGAFVAENNATVTGTLLLVAAWNEASTANESILRGLTQSVEGTGLALRYFDSRPRAGQLQHGMPSAEFLEANQVVGVALWAQSPADIPALQRLRAAVPLVLVDRRVFGFESDFVGFDNVSGGYQITRHLLKAGHRRIGFIGDEVFAETVQQRWRGYVAALEEARIVLDSAWVALYNGISEPSLLQHIRLMLAPNNQPLTALVCSNDSVAAYLLHLLHREGIQVPEDIAVTGYGGLLPNAADALQLTTVQQPFEEVGQAAGRLLHTRATALRTGQSAPPEPEQKELPVHLVIRTSSRFVPRS